MRPEEHSAKLKQRLGQWQTYVEQERSQLRSDSQHAAPDTGVEASRSNGDWEDRHPSSDTDKAPDTAYQERLSELEQQLQQERTRTEKLTTEFYQELMRRRKEPPSPSRGPMGKARQPHIFADRARSTRRKISLRLPPRSTLVVIVLSVLIGGICSLLVILTNLH